MLTILCLQPHGYPVIQSLAVIHTNVAGLIWILVFGGREAGKGPEA